MDFDLDKLARENQVERKQNAIERLINDLKCIEKLTLAIVKNNEIFPDETFKLFLDNDIWTHVFPFLANHTDIMNASLTCKSFKEELRQLPRTISIHRLEDVLRILHNNDYMKSVHDLSDHLEEPPEDKYPVLKLRLISKSWKRAVEYEFFERPFSSDDWHLSYNNEFERHSPGHCIFWRVDQLEQGISTLQNGSDSGHCLIRWIQLDLVSHDEDWIEYWERLIQFLDVYGHAVWGLSFSLCHDYQVLWEVVNRTPNVKALSIKHFTKIHDPAELERFRNHLADHPFTHVPSLKYLDSSYDVNAHLIAAIFKSNGHIKALRLFKCGKNAKDHFHIIQEEGGLNLIELERFEGPYYFYDGCGHLSETWPLKVLHLYQNLDCYRGDSLFPILNRYGETLIQLSLEDYFIFKGDSIKSGKVQLNLPHLKVLALHEVHDGNFQNSGYRGNLIELKDFVGLKSLEVIKVKRFCQDAMQVSKFFKAFPNLKEVHVQGHHVIGEKKIYGRLEMVN